jgi:hypothetical protein
VLVEHQIIPLSPELITIAGDVDGFVAGFTLRQSFRQGRSSPIEMRYIVPTNCKFYLYDTIFRVGSEAIQAVIEERSAAQVVYLEAVEADGAAILGCDLGNGLAQFTLGNVPGDTLCEVETKVAFTCAPAGDSSVFLKFPLNVCTPSGSVNCLTKSLTGAFEFVLPAHGKVASIDSNVAGEYDAHAGVYAVSAAPTADAIIATITLSSPLLMDALISWRALTVTALPTPGLVNTNNEFVLLVDCSGSMELHQIQAARECMKIFIRSIPPGSFFNVIRFGSTSVNLFETCVPYDDESAASAMAFASVIQANLGGTKLLKPLEAVFTQPRRGTGQRQVFLLTDGEVDNTVRLLALAAANRRQNRCFALGLGPGAEAGLVEGLASATGARASFVNGADDTNQAVTAQLEASLTSAFANKTLHVPGRDDVEVVGTGELTLFAIARCHLAGIQNVILSREDAGRNRDEVRIRVHRAALPDDVIQVLESALQIGVNDIAKQKLVKLSIEHGILCSHTALVGFIAMVCPRVLPFRCNRTSSPRYSSSPPPSPCYRGKATPRKSLGAKAARKMTSSARYSVRYEMADDREFDSDIGSRASPDSMMRIINVQRADGFLGGLQSAIQCGGAQD